MSYPCYSILKYVPNSPEGKLCNIGIVSCDESSTKVKLNTDVICSHPDHGSYTRLTSFIARIEWMMSSGEELNLDYITRMVNQYSDCVKMTIPAFHPDSSVDELLEWASIAYLPGSSIKIRRLVICGSMKQHEEMKSVKKVLGDNGVFSIVPSEFPPDSPPEFKQQILREYFRKIADKDTWGVLVFSSAEDGITGLGMNTFAEVAVAFEHGKRIYLMEGIPENVEDELTSWGAIPLNRSLDRIIKEYRENV